ncbi:hypothetical protein Pmani_026032 [Petrolisthes manimaculis]|uniref:E3 ubiquitin-protein ligase Sina-like RING finger domain-containing protein n=1 Tax=Petrolisthes manimaculis TaxID=1843537 RepID=A0AAE1P6R8_9EUCA|nr:hypothetical protein Pmani_026032 [Petrolisthes manimaculis]
MPGPLQRDASNDLALFESCEDVQEAWGGVVNGNFSDESLYHDCNKHFQTNTRTCSGSYQSQCVNGEEATKSTPSFSSSSSSHTQLTMATSSSHGQSDVVGMSELGCPVVKVSSDRHTPEDMELEDVVIEDDAVETINIPVVVEGSLSVDISKSLTRQKISSLQHGRTLSYADNEESQEAPTRRPRTHSHATDRMDSPGGPFTRPITRPETPKNGKVPPSAHRAIRVVRNPSYHIAVRDAAVASPQHTPNNQQQQADDSNTNQINKSCDSSPTRDAPPNTTTTTTMQTVMEDLQKVEISSLRLGSVGDEMTAYLSESLAANNMPRSVSFSGPESLSPDLLARPRGSISAGNSRSGSISQLASVLSSQHTTSTTTTHTRDKTSVSFVRGSAITRSFRRLFSPTSRSSQTASSSTSPPQKDDLWLDIPEPNTNTNSSDIKSPSRLRKISTNLSRRLSNRSTNKMATSPGSNGQYLFPNGATSPEDVSTLVEYDDLLKLFCCPGCQGFMTPPLYQCRKGHLVCNTCRFSLKQVCPICKQRFAENTNMMMEQVSELQSIKFTNNYMLILYDGSNT